MFEWLTGRKRSDPPAHFRFDPGSPPPAGTPIDLAYAAYRERCYRERWGMPSDSHRDPHPDDIEIDVLVFPPTDERSWWVLATNGLSDQATTTSEGARVELVLYVAEPDARYRQLLLVLAASTRSDGFQFGPSSALGLHPPMDPRFANPELNTVIFVPSSVPEDQAMAARFATKGWDFALLQLTPITSAELDFRFEHGVEALHQRLAEHRYPVTLDESRRCCVGKQRDV